MDRRIMNKVSVIVPVYNAENYLEECLNSLVNQTMEINIVVVDDHSTDSSYDIARSYEEKYPNVTVIHNKENKGVSYSRNVGIAYCNSMYIGFMDSDDFVKTDMYSLMYKKALENNFPGVISTGITFVSDTPLGVSVPANKVDSQSNRDDIGCTLCDLNSNPNELFWTSKSVNNKLFRRDLIDDYRFLEGCNIEEDAAFVYSMLIRSGSILNLRSNDYFYRKDVPGSLTTKVSEVNKDFTNLFRACDEIEKEAIKQGKYDHYKDQIKLIQLSLVIRRINQINDWNISLEEKNELKEMLYDLMIQKYGSLDEVDQALLSGNVSLDVVGDLSGRQK